MVVGITPETDPAVNALTSARPLSFLPNHGSLVDNLPVGEMAALAVNPQVQGRGDGERLLQRIEQRARAAGLKRLFVLTTRTMHWFLKRGFVLAAVDQLPTQRRGLYNWQRKSLVLVKHL